jgi:hypothetical protein
MNTQKKNTAAAKSAARASDNDRPQRADKIIFGDAYVDRLNITIAPPVKARLHTLMVMRGFINRSEFFATLVREEYDRRGAPPLIPVRPEGA